MESFSTHLTSKAHAVFVTNVCHLLRFYFVQFCGILVFNGILVWILFGVQFYSILIFNAILVWILLGVLILEMNGFIHHFHATYCARLESLLLTYFCMTLKLFLFIKSFATNLTVIKISSLVSTSLIITHWSFIFKMSIFFSELLLANNCNIHLVSICQVSKETTLLL